MATRAACVAALAGDRSSARRSSRSLAAIDAASVLTERPDERLELGDLVLALAPRELNLIGQPLEFLER